MSFVRTGRIGQWDVYELGSGSYVRTGRRTTRKGSTEKNTDPDSGAGCAHEQTSSKGASKLVKPTGGRCSGRVHLFISLESRSFTTSYHKDESFGRA